MKFLFLLPASLFFYPAFCQENAEAILQKAVAACKELKSINYEVYSENFSGKVTADITINRQKDFPIYGISQIKVQGIALGDDGSSEISFAFNGNRFEFFDVKKNAIMQIDSPSVSRVARTPMIAYMMLPLAPYCEKQPFENVFKMAKTIELQQDTVIYNIPCYSIKVIGEVESNVTGKTIIRATWYIGKKDMLIHGLASASGKQYIKIKNLDKNYDDDFFRVSSAKDILKITGNEPMSEELLKKGEQAPLWTLPGGNGEKISLEDLKGKVVLLEFWGTWCVPCIKAMPDIQAIYERFKTKDVVVIGVSVEMEKTAKPMDFVHRKGYTYSFALDGKQIVDLYKVKIFPTVYLIDKTGKIIHAEHTMRENFKEDIISRIEAALKE